MISSTIFFDDTPALLKDCLCALKANGLYVLAIDGAYQEFMQAAGVTIPHSTDGCLEVAHKYADKVIESPADGWVDEVEKRNQAFLNTPDGEYVFTVDADEIARPWNIETKNFNMMADAYRLMLYQKLSSGRSVERPLTRVFKKYPDLAYKYQHCRVYRLGQHVNGDISTGLVARAASAMNRRIPILLDRYSRPCGFDHVPERRPAERERIKKIFYHNMRERQFPY